MLYEAEPRARPPFGTPTLVLAPQKSAFSLDTFILACVGLIRDSSALCSEQSYQNSIQMTFTLKASKITIIRDFFPSLCLFVPKAAEAFVLEVWCGTRLLLLLALTINSKYFSLMLLLEYLAKQCKKCMRVQLAI